MVASLTHEISSLTTKINVSGDNNLLSKELKKTISQYPSLEIQKKTLTPPHITICFAGFGFIAQTEKVVSELEVASKNNSKFLLVIPDSRKLSIVKLTEYHQKFVKSHPVDSHLVIIPAHTSVSVAVQSILSKIIYNPQQKPNSLSVPEVISLGYLVLVAIVVSTIFYIVALLTLKLSISCLTNSSLSVETHTLEKCAKTTLLLSSLAKPFLSDSQTKLINKSATTALRAANIIYDSSDIFASLFSNQGYNLAHISLADHLQYLAEDIADLSVLARNSNVSSNIQAKLASYYALTTKIQSVIPDLLKLLNQEQSTQIAILIQDSAEIRPSGGYLDTIVTTTLSNGLLSPPKFISVTSLTGHSSEPVPQDFTRVTGLTQWYLRDSNWQPSFSESAPQIARILESQLSFRPDIIVALNLHSLSRLFAEKDLIPAYQNDLIRLGSKSPFIAKAGSDYYTKLTSLSPKDTANFLIALLKELESRQLLIYSRATGTTWNGELTLPGCRLSYPCLPDIFAVVDTNTGLNKANLFVNSQLKLQTTFGADRLDHDYQIIYTYPETQTSWPAGVYQNYLRLLIPGDSQLDSINIDSKPVSPKEYSISTFNRLTQVSVKLNVLPGASTLVSLKFHQSLPKSPYRYQLDIPRQPGAAAYPVSVSFHYPKDWSAVAYEQPSIANLGSLQYNTRNTGTVRIDLELTPNTQ